MHYAYSLSFEKVWLNLEQVLFWTNLQCSYYRNSPKLKIFISIYLNPENKRLLNLILGNFIKPFLSFSPVLFLCNTCFLPMLWLSAKYKGWVYQVGKLSREIWFGVFQKILYAHCNSSIWDQNVNCSPKERTSYRIQYSEFVCPFRKIQGLRDGPESTPGRDFNPRPLDYLQISLTTNLNWCSW